MNRNQFGRHTITLFLAWAVFLPFSVFGADFLRVKSKLQNEGKEYFVQFSIENISAKDLTLYRNSLPWVDRPGVLLLRGIALTPNFEEMKERGRLHNTVGTLTLKPGEVVNGRIKLNDRFIEFDRHHAESAIALLWVYIPRSPMEDDLTQVSGVLTVP